MIIMKKKDEKVTIDDMAKIAIVITDFINRKKYKDLDLLMKDFDYESINQVIMIGIARYTLRCKSKLNEWDNFLFKVKEELKVRNIRNSLDSI